MDPTLRLLGGLGVFLVALALLTENAKAVAGTSLRGAISRLTGFAPLAALVGFTGTAFLQSSSAVAVMVVGFVGAGVIPARAALAMLLGAAVGTTTTTWIVATLGSGGFMQVVAPILLVAGALARLFGRGKVAQSGMATASFGMLFVGMAMLSQGFRELPSIFESHDLPGASASGRLMLAGIGALLAVVTQSSAAVAVVALAAISVGSIDLMQGASLVAGASVGATGTTAMVAFRAGPSARRIAAAQIIFNSTGAIAALAATPSLATAASWLAALLVSDSWSPNEVSAVALAAFHSSFTLLSLILYLPWVRQLDRFLTRRWPDLGADLTRFLDRSVAKDPAAAVEAIRRTTLEISEAVLQGARSFLRGSHDVDGTVTSLDAAERAMEEESEFAQRVPLADLEKRLRPRHLSTMHAMDHLVRLVRSLHAWPRRVRAVPQAEWPKLFETGAELIDGVLAAISEKKLTESLVAQVQAYAERVSAWRRGARAEMLSGTAESRFAPDDASDWLESMRRLEQFAYHFWRLVAHLAETEAATSEVHALVEPRIPEPVD